jgi:hypothetical protein
MNQDAKTPQQRHGPYTSALWDHLAEITKLRQQRKTWEQVAAILAGPKREDRVVISSRAIRNFFIRARKPGRRIPAGFENTIVAGAEAALAQPTPQPTPIPTGEGNARKESTGHTYEKWEEAERKKDKNQSFKPYQPNE